MPSNALREGFREVLEDPGLLLTEIAWRWTFGAIALLIFALSVFVLLDGVSVDPRRFEAAAALPPFQLAQTVAMTLIAWRGAILRVSLVDIFAVTVCWVAMSALGRRATLVRPALFPGASLWNCFVVSIARAALTLGAILVWILSGIVGGLAGGSARDGLLNPAVTLGIVLPALLVILTVWSVLNWYFSLAPLFVEQPSSGKARIQIADAVWEFVCSRRDELLEISVITGAIRLGIFVAALMLSFAISAVVTNPRMLFADLLGIALLYFLAGDFVYIVRLSAYAKLREEQTTTVDASVAYIPAISG